MLKQYIQNFYKIYFKHYLYVLSYYGVIPLTKPSTVCLNPTYICNLRCLHCDFWKKKKREKELNTEEVKKLISDLKCWLGNFFLFITDAEPFIRKDIIEIADYATNKGVRVHLNTNGALINKDLAKRIINSKIGGIFISIHCLNQKKNDFLRGKKGVTKKTLDSIKYLTKIKKERNSNLKIRIVSIIMDQNLDDIMELVDFVKRNKQIDCINFSIIKDNFGKECYEHKWYKNSKLWFKDPEKAISLIDQLIKVKINARGLISNSFKELENMKDYIQNPLIRKKICLNFEGLGIDPYGNLTTCFRHSRVSIGNIKKQKIQKIWHLNRNRILKLTQKCDAACIDTILDYNVGYKKKIRNFIGQIFPRYINLTPRNDENAKL